MGMFANFQIRVRVAGLQLDCAGLGSQPLTTVFVSFAGIGPFDQMTAIYPSRGMQSVDADRHSERLLIAADQAPGELTIVDGATAATGPPGGILVVARISHQLS